MIFSPYSGGPRGPGGRFHSSRKRKRGVNYNDEIPFEKQPPLGFFDPSADTPEVERPNFKRMKHQDVLGMKRDEYERVSVAGAVVEIGLMTRRDYILFCRRRKEIKISRRNQRRMKCQRL